MSEKDLRQKFIIELSRLRNWNLDTIEQEKRLEIKAIVDKFIYQHLPDADKDFLVRRAKTSRMSLPPSLEAMKGVESAEQQIISIITLMEASETWEDFEGLNERRAAKKKDDLPEATQPKKELTDFDKILKGIMSVPKSDLEKNENIDNQPLTD
jgi:hypothetical protein